MKKATLTEDKAEQTPTGGVLVGKREGQTIIHNKGTLSGYLVGKTHAEGGIKAVNKSTGQPLEMQGGEVVITAPAVSDNTKREFEGKMMTNREILSAINEKGGGVAFAKGGDIPKSIKHTGASYKYGGKTMTDHEIMMKINGGHLAEGFSLREIASIHQVPLSTLKNQVRLGMKAESEHTKSKREQMKIVKDHLFENPKYYTLLKKAGLKDGGDLISVNVVESKNQKNSFGNNLPLGDKRFDIKSNNKIVGHIVVGSRWYNEESTKPDYYEVVKSSVKDQNKGIGTKAYIKLIDILDKPLHSDMLRTPQAESVWKKLEKLNLAKKSKDNLAYESYKNGGTIHKESLVKDAKSGNTPARDLNNYNDVLDIDADGMVGAETSLYADGGMMAKGGLIAPNGKQSNLTPEQYKLVRTPEFKAWFGDWENDPENASKVVDENGEPMVVYHTTSAEFNVFSKKKSKEGFFFAPQKERLSVYNKSNINSYFLNLRNPSHEMFKSDLKYLIPKGYDGIMDYGHAKHLGNKNLYEIIAFEPTQIKLADGTNTKFDNMNPDIRYADGGYLNNLSKKSFETIDSNYMQQFGFYDFNWNKESQRENFDEWFAKFKNEQFKKNLNKIISLINQDIELIEKRKESDKKLKDFEELILPTLGDDVKNPALSKYQEMVLMNPYASYEELQKGLSDTSIFNKDGSIDQEKITESEFFSEDGINLPRFEQFVEKNPEYKGVFDHWKKMFDENYQLSIKETNAFRYPSLTDLKDLKEELSNLNKKTFADGGEVEENKPYIFFFYDENGNEVVFNVLENARAEAKKQGVQKVRDNLGGEYFINYATGGDVKPYDANMEGDSADMMFAEGGAVSSVVNNWDEVPSIWKNTSKVKKVAFTNSPYDKGLYSIVAPFLGKDELRPYFGGINFDENGITVTDAHKLISLPYPNKKFEGIYEADLSKRVDSEEITIDGKYPDYPAVIPSYENTTHYLVDVYKLLQYSKVSEKYSNNYTHLVSFKIADTEYGFNANYLIVILTTMLKLGHEKIYAHYSSSNRPMVFTPSKNYELGNDEILLLMPTMIKDSFLGARDLDYNRELSVYYDFNDNEIHNADGSIADFKMNYENNSVISKEDVTLLEKLANGKNRLSILNYVLVKNGVAKATDLETQYELNGIDLPNGIYKSNKGALEITMEAMEDFPSNWKFEDDKDTLEFVISSDIFEYYIDKMQFIVGKDDLRPIMQGVCLHHTSDNKLFLASTDAHLLLKINITEYVDMPVYNREIKSILQPINLYNFLNSTENTALKIKSNKSNTIITNGDRTFYCRNLDGNFPNYDAVIPTISSKLAIFGLEQIRKAMNGEKVKSYLKESEGAFILNKENEIFVAINENRSNYNEQTKIKKIEKICDTSFDFRFEDFYKDDKSILLMMPVMCDQQTNFAFGTKILQRALKVINDNKLELHYNELNRAYLIPIHSLDYKTTTKEHKVREQKPSVAEVKLVSTINEVNEIKEAIETLEMLLETATRKDKKEIKEAIEVLQMLLDTYEY